MVHARSECGGGDDELDFGERAVEERVVKVGLLVLMMKKP